MSKRIYANELHRKLHEHKKNTGKSITQICTELDLTYNTMMFYCQSANLPNVRRAIKIARYLGVTVEDLWTPEK